MVLHLLLVEDNPDHALLIDRTLSSQLEWHARDRASSLTEATDRLRDRRYGLILLDLGLPESVGLATLDALLPHAGDVPVIVLTSDRDRELGLASIRQGAADFIEKDQLSTADLARMFDYAIARKRIEAQLRSTTRSLETVVQMLGHDLKAFPRRLRFAAEWAQETLDEGRPDRLTERLQDLGEIARGAEDVIEAAMTFATIGVQRLQLEPIELAALVEEIRCAMPAAKAAAINLQSSVPLRVDRKLFKALLTNLLENGLKHSGAPDPAVRVAGWCGDRGIEVVVTDNGNGISPEIAGKIFEPGIRSADSAAPGSGFGLAICRHIAQAHDGKITAESPAGSGAVFRIRLPNAFVPLRTEVLPIRETAPYRQQSNS